MQCKQAYGLITAYIDGDLTMKEREDLEAHFKQCRVCAKICEDVRTLVGKLGSLPPLYPQSDLWPGIRARLAGELGGSRTEAAGEAPIPPRLLATLRFYKALAYASLALVFVMAMLLLTPRLKELTPYLAVSVEEKALDECRLAEQQYEQAIAALNEAVEKQRSGWDAEFAAVFDRNLAKIDEAIAECKRAVEKSPGDLEARRFLLEAYHRKVDFLQEMSRHSRI